MSSDKNDAVPAEVDETHRHMDDVLETLGFAE